MKELLRVKFIVKSLPLEQLSQIRAGYQFRTEAPLSSDGNISIIQLRDSMEALSLADQEVQRYALPAFSRPDFLLKGDILLRAKGNNHYAVLVDRDLRNSLAGGFCMSIRCLDKNLSPGFLTWYLNQPPAQSYLNKISAGTALPIVNKKSLGSLSIPLPPLAKQQAIGELYQLQLKKRRLSRELLHREGQLLNSRMLRLLQAGKF